MRAPGTGKAEIERHDVQGIHRMDVTAPEPAPARPPAAVGCAQMSESRVRAGTKDYDTALQMFESASDLIAEYLLIRAK
jgi:hypothetical protein